MRTDGGTPPTVGYKMNKITYVLGYPYLKKFLLFNSHWNEIGTVNEMIYDESFEDDPYLEFWEIGQIFGGN